MKFLFANTLLVLALSGCATDATVRTSPEALSGTYYSGDGLGRNVTVVLKSDGTYTGDWDGCLGIYGQSAGDWQLHRDQILFTSSEAEGLLEGYLDQATTIRYEGRLGFVRSQDLSNEQINERLLFLKERSEE